jgi:uncharacterized YigZ family protein
MDEYKTLQEISEGLYKEKGSKFIAIATPAATFDEVKLQLELLRKRYHDARHHCYAYRLGEEPFEIRFSDDGEPSGTAGKPIFGQIQSFDLTNVLITVIRYFGNVKLGTGGLIRAYRAAARDAIENGKIIKKTWLTNFEIQFNYLQMNDVMHIIKDENLRIVSQDSSDQPSILLEIRKGNAESVLNKFSALEKIKCTVI